MNQSTSTYKFKPQIATKNLNDGEYFGVIKSIIFRSENKFCWFKILLEDGRIFNSMLYADDFILNEFAYHLVDDEGYFIESQAIERKIKFSTKQMEYNGKTICKISSIEIID